MQVSAAEFGAKYQSKREAYRFVSHDCGVYVDAYDNVTIYHLRDLASDQQLRIKDTEVKNISVP